MRNIFDEIRQLGHDEDFAPHDVAELEPTDAPVGSRLKLEVMANRVQGGFPIFHPDDSPDFGIDSQVRTASRYRKSKPRPR